jgi:hypothetical protein
MIKNDKHALDFQTKQMIDILAGIDNPESQIYMITHLTHGAR